MDDDTISESSDDLEQIEEAPIIEETLIIEPSSEN